jgi:hypothetical protein
MAPITLARARDIVGHAEDEFAPGRSIEDAFAPFARGGASTRLEALHALYIVIADYFHLASIRGSGSPNSVSEFDKYANLSESVAMRIMCDDVRDPAMLRNANGLGAQETVTSFVGYLRTLDPADADFWPRVYQRIGLDYPTQRDLKPEEKSAPAGKKASWRFW